MDPEARQLIDLIRSSTARLEHVLSTNGHARSAAQQELPLPAATTEPTYDYAKITVTDIVEGITPPHELVNAPVGTRHQWPLEACRRAQGHSKKKGAIRTLALTRAAVGNVLAKHGVRTNYKITFTKQTIVAERVR